MHLPTPYSDQQRTLKVIFSFFAPNKYPVLAPPYYWFKNQIDNIKDKAPLWFRPFFTFKFSDRTVSRHTVPFEPSRQVFTNNTF